VKDVNGRHSSVVGVTRGGSRSIEWMKQVPANEVDFVVPAQKPRRHHHLSRESIARAALELVDREGADALTLRALARSLSVGVTNLYTYYPDRESIVRDVVALLLAEVDVAEDPDASWEESIIAVGRSLRAMALRHPRAFCLVAGAPYDEWPLIEYGRRVGSLHAWQSMPPELIPELASMLDAYATGFLLLETQALVRTPAETWNPYPETTPLPIAYTVTNGDEAFEQGHRTILAGFKLLRGLSASAETPSGTT